MFQPDCFAAGPFPGRRRARQKQNQKSGRKLPPALLTYIRFRMPHGAPSLSSLDPQAAALNGNSRKPDIRGTGTIMNRGYRKAGISKCLSSTSNPIPRVPGSLSSFANRRERRSTELLSACRFITCMIWSSSPFPAVSRRLSRTTRGYRLPMLLLSVGAALRPGH